MKIVEGPMMRKYAELFGCDVDDVVEWVNGYVNGPWEPLLEALIEDTEKERFAHIRDYINSEIKTSD